MEECREPGSREELEAPPGEYQPDRALAEVDIEFEEDAVQANDEIGVNNEEYLATAQSVAERASAAEFAAVKSVNEAPSAPDSAEAQQGESDAEEPETAEEAEMLGGMFKRKKSNYEEFEESVMSEGSEDMEEGAEGAEEEVVEEKPKRKGKKAAQPKKKKRSIMPMLLILAIALLGGGGYIAWEMMSAPAPAPTYKPVAKPKMHPQEKIQAQAQPKPMKQASPIPGVPPAPPAPSEPLSATDLVAMEIAGMGQKQPTVGIGIMEERKPAGPEDIVAQKTPQAPQIQPTPTAPAPGFNPQPGGGSFESLERKLDEISKDLSEIRISLDRKPGAPTGSDQNGIHKTILQDMTTEIQTLTSNNKTLSGELTAAKNKITELREKIGKLEKQGAHSEKKPEKKSEPKKAASSAPASGSTNGWEILGFSGNRVVIADEQGTHVVNVGQAFKGVKVLAVDVEGGTVKTSAGTLKYGN